MNRHRHKPPGSKYRHVIRWLIGYWLLLVALTHWPNPWPQKSEPEHFDKLVHFSLYAVLATLAVRAASLRWVGWDQQACERRPTTLSGDRPPRGYPAPGVGRLMLTEARRLMPFNATAVLLIVVAFALLDEATQPLTRRDFDWWDWLADGLGALSGVVAYNWWRLRGMATDRGEANMISYKQLTDFLVSIGTDKVPHTNEVFLAHLIGVYRDMESWGCDDDLCRAGMFHSIYGTERFQRFSLPQARRGEVRDLIGPRAEWLAFVNCLMDRASFDRAAFDDGDSYAIVNRLTNETIVLPRAEFDDLCRVHLCDWLEQVPRSKEWDYRRPVYRRLAERLGGAALEAYDRVFTLESATTASA
jgi:VanZ family protein